jgi:alginate O-acetyltransferase complex protein AlgJ
MEIISKVRQVVADTFGVRSDDITEESTPDDIDGWDSLAHATLVLRLERMFAVDLPQDEAAAAQSPRELAELIARSRVAGVPPHLKEMVFIGRDGDFLFHRDHDAVEQITGASQLTAAELSQWVACIETRHAWCAARGIPYVHLIAPEKHVVYEELLPDGIGLAKDRPVTRLFAAVTGPARASLLYPLQRLRAHRTTRDTYYANDTHWTTYGAYLAYRELMGVAQRHLPVEPVCEDALHCVTRRHIGDLGVRMTPEQITNAAFLEYITPPSYRIAYENKVFGRGSVTIYEGPDRTAPRALLFHDSFSVHIIPYLIPVFSRLTAVGSLHMLYDLLHAERPDIVFFEMVERFIAFRFGPDGEKLLIGDLSGIDTAEFIGIPPQELARY